MFSCHHTMKKEKLIERYITKNLSYDKARARMKATKHEHFIRKKEYLALKYNYRNYGYKPYTTKQFKGLKEKLGIRTAKKEIDKYRLRDTVYRASITYGYSTQKQNIRLRLWVHYIRKNKVTDDDLIDRYFELIELLNFGGQVDRYDMEVNELIDNDEMTPNDALTNEWMGYMQFKRGGVTREYRARTKSHNINAKLSEVKESWTCD